jgi:hypothetical protein
MKQLAEIIQARFPGAIESFAARVQDDMDSKGPYIAHWNEAKIGAPKPDAAALVAAYRAEHPGA